MSWLLLVCHTNGKQSLAGILVFRAPANKCLLDLSEKNIPKPYVAWSSTEDQRQLVIRKSICHAQATCAQYAGHVEMSQIIGVGCQFGNVLQVQRNGNFAYRGSECSPDSSIASSEQVDTLVASSHVGNHCENVLHASSIDTDIEG